MRQGSNPGDIRISLITRVHMWTAGPAQLGQGRAPTAGSRSATGTPYQAGTSSRQPGGIEGVHVRRAPPAAGVRSRPGAARSGCARWPTPRAAGAARCPRRSRSCRLPLLPPRPRMDCAEAPPPPAPRPLHAREAAHRLLQHNRASPLHLSPPGPRPRLSRMWRMGHVLRRGAQGAPLHARTCPRARHLRCKVCLLRRQPHAAVRRPAWVQGL